MEWCTIESDPAVFTELLENIGVKGVNVEEVYSLDDDAYLRELGTIYGFIFLFRYTKNTESRNTLVDFDPELFYARQLVTNACGTQALLSVVLNVPELQMGDELKDFKDFTMNLDPESRGYALGESELLRKNHNMFAKPEPFIYQQTRKAKDGDDVFHFIAYVPFKNQVYELDGVEQGPILLGDTSADKTWIDIAKQEINKRIEKYSQKEIRFTLLAVTKSKGHEAEARIAALKKMKGHFYTNICTLESFDKNAHPDYEECVEILLTKVGLIADGDMRPELPVDNHEEVRQKLNELDNEISALGEHVLAEKARRDDYKLENERRKHNYIPFILELLKIASEKGELQGQYEKAKTSVGSKPVAQ